jgi:hypothetical protein
VSRILSRFNADLTYFFIKDDLNVSMTERDGDGDGSHTSDNAVESAQKPLSDLDKAGEPSNESEDKLPASPINDTFPSNLPISDDSNVTSTNGVESNIVPSSDNAEDVTSTDMSTESTKVLQPSLSFTSTVPEVEEDNDDEMLITEDHNDTIPSSPKISDGECLP